MNKVYATKLYNCSVEFNDGTQIYSEHSQDCCESHKLDFSKLSLEDFQGLEFDLTKDSFFERVDGYGIRLIPLVGHPVSVPGYGSNNGYYSSNMSLVVKFATGKSTVYDISECQDY